MTDKTRRVLAWLPLAGVAALAVRAASVWDRLPSVMMSHFDARGIANGWMPRNSFFAISFVVVTPAVVLLAVMADRIGRRKPAAGWGVLALGWFTDAVLITTFWGAITANLENAPLRVIPIWAFLIAVLPIAVAVGIDWRWWLSRTRRDAVREASSAQIVTEQRHGSTKCAALSVLPAVGLAFLLLALPSHGRPAFIVPLFIAAIVVILAAAVWAWQGFVYRFTTKAIEIRALGFRLRSIPLSQIKDFRSERCNPLTDFGGWGVKGFGSDTAYIWGGHKVLHICTDHGDVYLGHQDPDRLVRDLEALMTPAR